MLPPFVGNQKQPLIFVWFDLFVTGETLATIEGDIPNKCPLYMVYISARQSWYTEILQLDQMR